MSEQVDDPAITAARQALQRVVKTVGGTSMGTDDHIVLHPAIQLGRQLSRPRIEIYFFDEGRVDFSTGWFIRHALDIDDIVPTTTALINGQAEERIIITPDGELVEDGWTIWGPDFSIGERKPPRADLLVHRLPSWEAIRRDSNAPRAHRP